VINLAYLCVVKLKNAYMCHFLSMGFKVCPRCGEKFTSIEVKRINGRVYYYAVHSFNGFRRKCYLGPEYYEYVTRLHFNELTLQGAVIEERLINYLLSIIETLNKMEIEKLRNYKTELKQVITTLKTILNKIETD